MKVVLALLLLTGCGAYRDRIKPKDGKPGSSCTTRQDSVGVFVECTDGTDSFIPFPKNGKAGEAGSSCSVNDSGLVTCTDGSFYQIENGQDGADGRDAQATIIQICPGDTATHKEQGFVIDGELYAVYYDHAKKQSFLAKLTTGTYKTTNGSNCQFTYVKTPTELILSNVSGTTTVPLAQ